MKTLAAVLSIALAGIATSASAADAAAPEKKAPSAQQTKMKECNAQAKGKKGDERRAFMKECLKKKPA